MDNYTVQNTHKALKGKLVDYIKAQYLVNSDLLYDPISEQMEHPGTVCKEPFLEATPAYEKVSKGIQGFNIHEDLKKFLVTLAEKNLGVFRYPYTHQKLAVEEYERGRDLIITTGTGSGKSECFIWSILCKMAKETLRETWNKEGIRTLIIYPMNALVSDQVSRIRRIMDPESEFGSIFKNVSGKDVRLPKFGMYTGRTPYPGESSLIKNRSLGKVINKDYINKTEAVIQKLKEMGKWPSKYDLKDYAEGLLADTSNHSVLNALDMEMITRHEMQVVCPDIMITNYSMLEYMLIRPIERTIWNKTRDWIRSDPENNKLLVVLDEAHMYRGAPGGEIALLLRRLISKLRVSRDSIQFILTSASMPENQDDELRQFVVDLSGAKTENVSIIKGVPEKIEEGQCCTLRDAQIFSNIEVTHLHDDDHQLSEVRGLAVIMGWSFDESSYRSQLFDNLLKLPYMRILIKECRSRACTIDELVETIFPNIDNEIRTRAIEALIILGAIAKKDDVYLLPMRSHIFMRGIRSVYTCINPNCSKAVSGDGLQIGSILINDKRLRCQHCGSLTFEIMVDRRCNGIFIRGYKSSVIDNDILWNYVDPLIADSFEEVDMYLLKRDMKPSEVRAALNKCGGELGYIIARTGQFLQTLSTQDNIQGIRVLKANFTSCPSCGKPSLNLRTLTTRGNEPFSNVIFDQLRRQPAKTDTEDLPNGGRKVLLFSDSRQRAAKLARDMTLAADGDTGRKVILKAAQLLAEWSGETGDEITLDQIYGLFIRIVYNHKLSFFYGSDKELFQDDLQKYERRCSSNPNIKRIIQRFNGTRPELYQQQLLRQLTDSFQSLHDMALAYLGISDKHDEDILELIEDTGVEERILRNIIIAWIANSIIHDKAIGTDIKDDVRRNLTQYADRRRLFGMDNIKLTRNLKKILTDNGHTNEQIDTIEKWIEDTLTDANIDHNNNKYIKQDSLVLHVTPDEEWVRCKHCCSVFKFGLYDRCIFCGNPSIEQIDEGHMNRLGFWRDPVIEILNMKEDYRLYSTDIEEHTAQLTYVDKNEKALATTEEYEMLFQDFIDDKGKRPVDILSCTTTMEVGIDIGSLTAIGMRNVPPSRNNYQQRAGRAGRKSSSVSTVITYTEDGPHDAWYYANPNEIVRGIPRTPWVDIKNEKLIKRHLNMIVLSKYFENFAPEQSVDSIYAYNFFANEECPSASHFVQWVNSHFRFDENDLTTLIPDGYFIEDYFTQLSEKIRVLGESICKNPYVLISPQNVENEIERNHLPSLLDILYREAILPTYSFPRDVVNYWIEDKQGRIDETPQRAIDIALSEYAPGRLIVVNKKSYISGGIYNHFSKRNKDQNNKPAAAEPWLSLGEYKDTYCYCQRCKWMSKESPDNGLCPLCNMVLVSNDLIKPWGFTSKEGKSIPETLDQQIYSSTSIPIYSTTPDTNKMIAINGASNLKVESRKDQRLMVVNRGPKNQGFRICKLCGASEPSDVDIEGQGHIRPYKLFAADNQKCYGTFIENASIGYEFLTDMMVLEIPLNKSLLNADICIDKDLWLNPAVSTFTEALAKAAGIFLDVDFEDIQSGYRFRDSDSVLYADVFLYDKLVSGAGYSTMAYNFILEIVKKTRELLNGCNCDDSCPNCLQHFHNQQIQSSLNRKLGLELIDWVLNNKIRDKISLVEQSKLLHGLNDLLLATNKGEVKFNQNRNHIIEYLGNQAEICVYPSMWSNHQLVNSGIVYIPDRIALNGLPRALEIVEQYFGR